MNNVEFYIKTISERVRWLNIELTERLQAKNDAQRALTNVNILEQARTVKKLLSNLIEETQADNRKLTGE